MTTTRCKICSGKYTPVNKKAHERTKKHIKSLDNGIVKTPDKTLCHCGGKYTKHNHAVHMKTKRHVKAQKILDRKIEMEAEQMNDADRKKMERYDRVLKQIQQWRIEDPCYDDWTLEYKESCIKRIK